MTNRNILAFCIAASGASACCHAGTSWIAGGYTGSGGTNRGVFDYAEGSSTLTNFRYQQTQNWGIAGVEYVAGTTYVMTTFNDNRLNVATFSGNTMSLTPVTGPLGNSAEGDVGFNPADGHFYVVENTPFTSTKSIWRVDPNGWAASVAGTFTADDPSGICFDNSGNAFVLDTHGNGSGVAELLRFDVMSSPGNASFVSGASLGFGTGPTAGMDFNQSTNEMYVMSLNGAFWRVNSFLGTPSGQLIDVAQGADYVTGLAWVPAPGSLAALLGLGGLSAVRRRRT